MRARALSLAFTAEAAERSSMSADSRTAALNLLCGTAAAAAARSRRRSSRLARRASRSPRRFSLRDARRASWAAVAAAAVAITCMKAYTHEWLDKEQGGGMGWCCVLCPVPLPGRG